MEEDGRKDQKSLWHKCFHEEDWKTMFRFMGDKEATNGALKDKDNSLDGKLTRIEDKLDKMIWGLLIIAASVIVALIK